MTTFFENLVIELHILYALNTHDKFCGNRILFIIGIKPIFVPTFSHDSHFGP